MASQTDLTHVLGSLEVCNLLPSNRHVASASGSHVMVLVCVAVSRLQAQGCKLRSSPVCSTCI